MKYLLMVISLVTVVNVFANELPTLVDLNKMQDTDDSESSYILGLYYDLGYGVPQDYKKAAKFYRLSSHPHSYTMEAILFNNGQGVKLDFRKANELYRKNAKQEKHELYLEILEDASHKNIKASALLSIELIFSENPDCQQGLILLRRALENNYVPAMYTMAMLYSGKTTCLKGNNQKSEEYYLKAAENGFPQAMNNLSVLYEDKNVEESKEKSLYWLKKAAKTGVMKAQIRYGFKHYDGEWIKRDKELAYKWWQDASNQNNAYAMFLVGYMLVNGDGVGIDMQKGMDLLHLSAKNDICEAQYEISYILLREEKDLIESRSYLNKSIENGCKDWRNLNGWLEKKSTNA